MENGYSRHIKKGVIPDINPNIDNDAFYFLHSVCLKEPPELKLYGRCEQKDINPVIGAFNRCV